MRVSRRREVVLRALRNLLAALDLRYLGLAEIRKGRPAVALQPLGLRQAGLHLLLELLQDAQDLTALREVRRVVVAAVALLHEGGRRAQGLVEEGLVLPGPHAGAPHLGLGLRLLQEAPRGRLLLWHPVPRAGPGRVHGEQGLPRVLLGLEDRPPSDAALRRLPMVLGQHLDRGLEIFDGLCAVELSAVELLLLLLADSRGIG
mmetsp:Transcript_105877/g.330136  ORF Transcript_105877/g.330136 Transcript_105877/m.330136 type:complete len:203 (-) Transcript_105877:470-1078(-)